MRSSVRREKLDTLALPLINWRVLSLQSSPRVLPVALLVQLESTILSSRILQMTPRRIISTRDRQTQQFTLGHCGIGSNGYGYGVESVGCLVCVEGSGAESDPLETRCEEIVQGVKLKDGKGERYGLRATSDV